MTYSNMYDFTKQLASDPGDRISAFETNYTFYPDEVRLVNESESVRVIAAIVDGLTSNFMMVNSKNNRCSFREVTEKVIDELNSDNSRHPFINTGVEMIFGECRVTNIKFQVNKQTLSLIVKVAVLDLYRNGDVLANYFKLYLLIVAKITKLSVGELRVDALESYVLKNDVNKVRDMPNNNTTEVVLADTLIDLNFTVGDIGLKA